MYFSALVTFGINILFGKLRLNGSDHYVGAWNPKNAEDFMKYTLSKGYKMDSYELGTTSHYSLVLYNLILHCFFLLIFNGLSIL